MQDIHVDEKSSTPRTIFVTVGTTLFDPLIDAICHPVFLDAASRLYGRLIVQYGKGKVPSFPPNSTSNDNDCTKTSKKLEDSFSGIYVSPKKIGEFSIQWTVYRFKPSLDEDMQTADLILSHAGAGSIMEGLTLCRQANTLTGSPSQQHHRKWIKRLVVVINNSLMHNHQSELAEALEKRGYLYVLLEPELLLEEGALDKIQSFQPKKFLGGDKMAFSTLLDIQMGFGAKDVHKKEK